jgi:hypothetical protein
MFIEATGLWSIRIKRGPADCQLELAATLAGYGVSAIIYCFYLLILMARVLLERGMPTDKQKLDPCLTTFPIQKEMHMDFTEKELREQDQAVEALKEELSRLNAQFDGLLKDAGLSAEDLAAAREEDLTPEMARWLEQAKAEAARAGQARAAQFQAETAPAARNAGRGRPGAVRI